MAACCATRCSWPLSIVCSNAPPLQFSPRPHALPAGLVAHGPNKVVQGQRGASPFKVLTRETLELIGMCQSQGTHQNE